MILQKLGCEATRTPTERPWEPILFSHGNSFRNFFLSALITRLGILGSSCVLKEFSPQSLYFKRSGQPSHDSSRTQAFICEDQIVWRGIDWGRMGPEHYGITNGLCRYFAKMKRHRQEWWGPCYLDAEYMNDYVNTDHYLHQWVHLPVESLTGRPSKSPGRDEVSTRTVSPRSLLWKPPCSWILTNAMTESSPSPGLLFPWSLNLGRGHRESPQPHPFAFPISSFFLGILRGRGPVHVHQIPSGHT